MNLKTQITPVKPIYRNIDAIQFFADNARYAVLYRNVVTANSRQAKNPVACVQLDPQNSVEVLGPDGTLVRINGSGFIASNGGTDIYGIESSEFKENYSPCFPNGQLIPKDVWNQAYKNACQDAYETRLLQHISFSDNVVLRTTWDSIVSTTNSSK